jgi:hypothetical protein
MEQMLFRRVKAKEDPPPEIFLLVSEWAAAALLPVCFK